VINNHNSLAHQFLLAKHFFGFNVLFCFFAGKVTICVFIYVSSIILQKSHVFTIPKINIDPNYSSILAEVFFQLPMHDRVHVGWGNNMFVSGQNHRCVETSIGDFPAMFD
jgi:hypothetical protein